MNLHEYQAKEVLRGYGLPMLKGALAYTAGEVEAACDELLKGSQRCVVKAQVHAGGRGKAGGVKVVASAADGRAAGEKILGMRLVTPQTGAAGKLVRKVYVESGCEIARELYLALTLNRAKKCLALVGSAKGGMEIEELAKSSPSEVLSLEVSSVYGVNGFQIRELARKLGIDKESSAAFERLVRGLYQAFLERDCSLLEINPLVVTKSGEFVILDAKMAVDDNALFRQPEIARLLDYDETDERDLRAAKVGVSYVGLDGNIGCMVNGAGLAMATMDLIKRHGGEPANFLDVGGGASQEMVRSAFGILLSDPRVQGILVNIFGGIMRCDVVATGVVAAARELKINIPLVVRLQGTNVEQGKKILEESGLKIIAASSMDDAGRMIVEATKKK